MPDTDDDLTPAQRRLFAKAMRAAFAKGEAAGRAEATRFLDLAARLNGSAHAVRDTLTKAWDEGKHPRDHGRFSSAPGAGGGSDDPEGHDHLTAGLEAHVPAGAWARVRAAARAIHQRAVLATPAAYRVLAEVLGGVFDTPDDLKKIGYNPTASSGTAGHDLGDPVRDATGVSAHLAANVACKVLTNLGMWIAKKMHEPRLLRKADGDGYAEAAELLAGVLADLGVPDPPDAAAVEAALRGNANAGGDADPHHAVGLAMLDQAAAALEAGEDPGHGVEALRALLDDPAALAKVLAAGGADDATIGKCFRKAWSEADHPRGKGGVFISKDKLEAAKTDPKVAAQLRKEVRPEDAHKLEAVISGDKSPGRTKRGEARHQAGQRRLSRQEAKAKTDGLVAHLKRVGDLKAELSPEHLHDLADHIAAGHMTVADLRAARAALAGTANRAGFGGARTKEGMAKALAEHARKAGFEARLKEQGISGDAADEMRAAAAGVKDAAPGGASVSQPPDPLDLTPENVKETWERFRDEIVRHDPKMSPAQAGSIAAARILNQVGERAAAFIDDTDARVKRGEPITDEEDAKYIAAHDARRNLAHPLAQLSGYRPHQTLDEHPLAQRPFDAPPLEDTATPAAQSRADNEARAEAVTASVAARRAGLTPVRGRVEWDGRAVEDAAGGKTVYRDAGGNLHASIAEHQRKQHADAAAKKEGEQRQAAEAAKAEGERTGEAARRQARANAETVSRHFDARLRKELQAAGHGKIARRVKYGLGGSRLPDDAPEEAVNLRNRLVDEYGRAQAGAGGLSAHPDQIAEALERLAPGGIGAVGEAQGAARPGTEPAPEGVTGAPAPQAGDLAGHLEHLAGATAASLAAPSRGGGGGRMDKAAADRADSILALARSIRNGATPDPATVKAVFAPALDVNRAGDFPDAKTLAAFDAAAASLIPHLTPEDRADILDYHGSAKGNPLLQALGGGAAPTPAPAAKPKPPRAKKPAAPKPPAAAPAPAGGSHEAAAAGLNTTTGGTLEASEFRKLLPAHLTPAQYGAGLKKLHLAGKLRINKDEDDERLRERGTGVEVDGQLFGTVSRRGGVTLTPADLEDAFGPPPPAAPPKPPRAKKPAAPTPPTDKS